MGKLPKIVVSSNGVDGRNVGAVSEVRRDLAVLGESHHIGLGRDIDALSVVLNVDLDVSLDGVLDVALNFFLDMTLDFERGLNKNVLDERGLVKRRGLCGHVALGLLMSLGVLKDRRLRRRRRGKRLVFVICG